MLTSADALSALQGFQGLQAARADELEDPRNESLQGPTCAVLEN